ncbi:uncharacterized protein LOC123593297 isoform X1 [Leopardus geoffroyi]|uniref:uncharacterized protein LOC123593297 isoform X1 n=1 Tax=Leopardus geoffroyi TaxID=46844 RepID=UPI001E26484F|nr:uncharacterized protein LOC123593297 isoform X1 [Leopardus geoffroyi]
MHGDLQAGGEQSPFPGYQPCPARRLLLANPGKQHVGAKSSSQAGNIRRDRGSEMSKIGRRREDWPGCRRRWLRGSGPAVQTEKLRDISCSVGGAELTHPSIQLVINFFLSIYSTPDTVPGAGFPAGNKVQGLTSWSSRAGLSRGARSLQEELKPRDLKAGRVYVQGAIWSAESGKPLQRRGQPNWTVRDEEEFAKADARDPSLPLSLPHSPTGLPFVRDLYGCVTRRPRPRPFPLPRPRFP